LFFQFHHSKLDYLALSFVILSTFLIVGLSQFHILSHGLVELTWVGLCFFSMFFKLIFFHFSFSSFSLFESWPLSFYLIFYGWGFPGLTMRPWIWHADTSHVFLSFLKLIFFPDCSSTFALLIIELQFFFNFFYEVISFPLNIRFITE
jgi:hypothetical protein